MSNAMLDTWHLGNSVHVGQEINEQVILTLKRENDDLKQRRREALEKVNVLERELEVRNRGKAASEYNDLVRKANTAKQQQKKLHSKYLEEKEKLEDVVEENRMLLEKLHDEKKRREAEVATLERKKSKLLDKEKEEVEKGLKQEIQQFESQRTIELNKQREVEDLLLNEIDDLKDAIQEYGSREKEIKSRAIATMTQLKEKNQELQAEKEELEKHLEEKNTNFAELQKRIVEIKQRLPAANTVVVESATPKESDIKSRFPHLDQQLVNTTFEKKGPDTESAIKTLLDSDWNTFNEETPLTKGDTKITEIVGNIFEFDGDMAITVSENVIEPTGVSAFFFKKFGGRDQILSQEKSNGEVAVVQQDGFKIYYLICKEKSINFPSYKVLYDCICQLAEECKATGVTTLGLPALCCNSRTDKLKWANVKTILSHVFNSTGIHLVVYSK